VLESLLLDDLIVFSSSFEGMLQDVDKVLTSIRAMGLTLSPAKCLLSVPTVKVPGSPG